MFVFFKIKNSQSQMSFSSFLVFDNSKQVFRKGIKHALCFLKQLSNKYLIDASLHIYIYWNIIYCDFFNNIKIDCGL